MHKRRERTKREKRAVATCAAGTAVAAIGYALAGISIADGTATGVSIFLAGATAGLKHALNTDLCGRRHRRSGGRDLQHCDTYYGELRRDLPQGIPRRREGQKSRLPWKIDNRREKEDGQQLSVFSFALLLSLPEKKRDVGKKTPIS